MKADAVRKTATAIGQIQCRALVSGRTGLPEGAALAEEYETFGTGWVISTVVTCPKNRYPFLGTVSTTSGSPSALRTWEILWARVASSTNASAHTCFMHSALLTRRPAFSTRRTRVSKTLGVRGTGLPWRTTVRSAGSS